MSRLRMILHEARLVGRKTQHCNHDFSVLIGLLLFKPDFTKYMPSYCSHSSMFKSPTPKSCDMDLRLNTYVDGVPVSPSVFRCTSTPMETSPGTCVETEII